MNSRLYKFFLFLLFVSCLATRVNGQVNHSNLKGIVVDETGQPIPGATLMVLNAADSVLAVFGSSDIHGAFLIKNVPKGNFLLNVTFLGMTPIFQPFTSGTTDEIDLGTIKMVTASHVLNQVEVKADAIPIEIKKDTIAYNADAYKTQPNANVEDLLKKLPGIEVAKDGSIKAQGEDVQKVLVDGKEFFGSDPTLATKNLPARAVKKIKVYDKKSDMAEFTGVDDGETEKTIDVQLREDFKQGLFGTAEGGLGTDDKYNAKASINRFSKTSQVSVLGQLNNINEQGFTFRDMMNFSGGTSGMGGRGAGGGGSSTQTNMTSNIPLSNGLSNGLVNTGAGGVNFNWHKTKNFNIRSSYFYNGVNKTILQDITRQNSSDDPFNTNENNDQATKNHTHNISLASDIKLDSTQQITIRATTGFGNGSALNEDSLKNYIPVDSVLNTSHTNTNNGGNNFSLSASTTYMKRFGNRGRNFSANGTLTKGDNNQDSKLDALTQYFLTGDSQLLDQIQNTTSNTTRWEGQLSYTEPLKKRKYLEFNYYYSNQQDKYDHGVSDIVDSTPVFNPILSNDYLSLYQYHRPGVTFRYSGDIHNLNVGLQYQVTELTGHLSNNENQISKQYYNFLPRIIWRYDIGNGKNLMFRYTTRVNQPSITQLSPVVDNSDPLRLYVGNPKLNAEFSHNLNINYHSFTQFTSTSFFVSLGGSLTEHKIITSRTVDDKFRELTLPVNIDHESRFNFFASYGRPLKPIHSRVTINANGSLTKTQNLIDTVLVDLNRWSRTAGLTISNMNSDVLEYNFGSEWTFTDSYYKSNDALNQNTVLQNYFIDATLTLWKKWKLQGSYDYNLYTSKSFTQNQALPLMKVSLSRFILPKDRGQLKFSIFDVLDENRGISQTLNINYIEEVKTNSIGRYAMLSFVYSIKGQGNEPKGGMNMMMIQRH